MSGQVELFPAPQRVPVRVPPASGFVRTPEAIVDLMVAKLFDGKPPSRASTVLDPGCGPGAFEAGIIRWCRRTRAEMPKIVGVESDPERYAEAAGKFRVCDSITIVHEDFLVQTDCRFDYVIGNPRRPTGLHHAGEVPLCKDRRIVASASWPSRRARDPFCPRRDLRRPRDVSNDHHGGYRHAERSHESSAPRRHDKDHQVPNRRLIPPAASERPTGTS